VAWTVLFHEDFEGEFGGLDVEIQIEVLAYAEILAERGPTLGRPHVDTLKGSRHPNMKEIRFRTTDGVWRVAFAFDPKRQAVLLVAGDKSGVSQTRFYRTLISTADKRFSAWLANLDAED
jgi:hypothetical protein